jgi:hypothetical protein
MQAVNYPHAPEPPFVEPAVPDAAPVPEAARHRVRLGPTILVGGAALVLVLAASVIGALIAGPPVVSNPPPSGLGGFAEMYLSTLLTQAGTGREDVVAPYLGYRPDLEGLEPGTWYITHTAVWSVDPAGPEAWRVLVAATQLGLQRGGYVPAGIFFYEVDIEQTPTGLRATALPTLVAAPAPTAPNAPTPGDVDDGLAEAVTEFLVARFTAPETTPFDAAPFTKVIVRSIRPEDTGGDYLDVGVEFLGVDRAGRATPLGYRVLVSTLDGSIVEPEDVNRVTS